LANRGGNTVAVGAGLLNGFLYLEEFMKKVLVLVLLAFFAAGGGFAQVSVAGAVQVDVGIKADTEESDNNEWFFNPNGGGTTIKAVFETDGVTGFVRFAVGGFHSAQAAVAIGPGELAIGYNELPWVQWSSLNFMANNNWGFGASASNQNTFIQFGAGGFYIGICDAKGGIDFMGTDISWNLDGSKIKGWKIPGFYVGYDLLGNEAFSAGFAFAGTMYDKDYWIFGDDGTFPFMLNAHAKFDLSPITLGLNAALYSLPERGFFTITAGEVPIDIVATGDEKNMVVEGMVDVGIGLDPCNIAFTGALVANMSEKDKGGQGAAIRLGASADFNLGGGFTLTPGLIFTTILKGPGDSEYDNGNLAIGATFSYSF
jgi:hypothetical protein